MILPFFFYIFDFFTIKPYILTRMSPNIEFFPAYNQMDAWLCRNRRILAEYEAKQLRLHIKELEMRKRKYVLSCLHFFSRDERPVHDDGHHSPYHHSPYHRCIREHHHSSYRQCRVCP